MRVARDRAADDLAHALDDPLPPSVGVPPGKLHGGQVRAPQVSIDIDQGGRGVDTLFAPSELQVLGRARMPQATASEMYANPNEPVFVTQQIDVMVPRAYGAELSSSFAAIVLHARGRPGRCIVE